MGAAQYFVLAPAQVAWVEVPPVRLRHDDPGKRYRSTLSQYHGDGSREGLAEATTLTAPTAVIEVLLPSTTTFDQGTMLEEHERVPSIRTIAFVDPVEEMCRTVERTSETGWLDHIFSGRDGIAIPTIDLAIPHEEIVAGD